MSEPAKSPRVLSAAEKICFTIRVLECKTDNDLLLCIADFMMRYPGTVENDLEILAWQITEGVKTVEDFKREMG